MVLLCYSFLVILWSLSASGHYELLLYVESCITILNNSLNISTWSVFSVNMNNKWLWNNTKSQVNNVIFISG